MRQPLASRIRPNKIEDILGQKELFKEDGIIKKCLEKGVFFSSIFYGPPGVGKTTVAKIIANTLNKPYRQFSAVTGNKKDLDAIFLESKVSDGLILICDEVHRLNKDKQDLLLPYLEDGSIIMIGCTTANPYHSINPAIRSRCHLIEFKKLEKEDIKEGILKAITSPLGLDNKVKIEEEAINKIGDIVNGDIRWAYNILELASITSVDNLITLKDINKACKNVNNQTFGSEDGYYDLLSCLQKSIRGSDADAALYYLALLAQGGELEGIVRRLLVIGYEDIGLANPALASRGYMATQAALTVGFPEAIIPLGIHIIDLCLSPKSRSGIDAIHKAQDIASTKANNVPTYLKLTPVGLNDDEQYNYERYDCFHLIQYLPDEIKDEKMLEYFNHNRYESQLEEIYKQLKQNIRTSDLKTLYKKKG